MIDNLTYGFRNACIMDAKLGRITWTKHHKPEKIESQMAKAKTTTTGSLGFRLCGMVVKDSQGQKVEAWTKDDGFFNITADNIHEHFAKLVTKNGRLRVDLVDKLIEQTQRMLDWFLRQKVKHFITTSILYVTGDEEHPHCQAKLIDFAHVMDAEGQLDESN
jgi:1D-myo-inositol-tetrakisphosphate 5-kinase/inositol-polyphosphate multikinase